MESPEFLRVNIMEILGHIHKGQVILDRPAPWPEGTRVQLEALADPNGQANSRQALPTNFEFTDVSAQAAPESLDWDVHIDVPPPRTTHEVIVQFIPGGFRPPRMVTDDTQE